MKHVSFLTLFLAIAAPAAAQTPTPIDCLHRICADADDLLQKNQPPLFAWHLRSIKALAENEFATLSVNVAQVRHPVADREKEFVEYTTAISQGLETDCNNPDDYLKNGLRGLVLARPSDIDGSLQYIMLTLPKDWDPSKAYPLSIGLHGTGPDNPLAYPSYGFGRLTPPAPGTPEDPEAQMVRLTPWGRGNRGWRGDAEQDLWEAINEVKSICKLDPDRWYITGHSAGADGSWAIVQHTPDLWAAGGMQAGSMLSGRPEWGLIPNMKYVPFHILIGDKDPSPGRIPDSKEAYRILKGYGDDTELVILPGIGHYPLTDEALREQAAWMVSHVRHRPDRFSFTVDQSRHPGVWGITVANLRGTQLIKEPWPSFECEIRGQDVHIRTEHIKALNIVLGDTGLRMSGNVRVWVNRKKILDGPVPDEMISVKDL